MAKPIVYGPTYSTYVRSVRLALEEKGVAYDLVDVAMLQGAHKHDVFLKRNPFGKVPAFEHDGFGLYETGAIMRYVDRASPGPALQPTDAKSLARMDQVMSIIDSFAYGSIIGQLVWQRLVTPMTGGDPDEGIIAAALPTVRLCLAELEHLIGAGPWFGGASLSLADLHVAPVFAYLTMTSEGPALTAPHSRMGQWWHAMSVRGSMNRTQPQFG